MLLPKLIAATHVAAYAFTAGRLVALGLTKRQPALLSALSVRCLLALMALVLPQASTFYFWSYVLLSPLDGPVSFLAVRESLGLVLHQYPGIRSIAQWTMYGAVAVALFASIVLSAAYWRGSGPHTNLYYIEVFNRSLTFALAVVVTSLLLFLSHYRLDLSRNRLVSSVAFGGVVLADAVTLFIDSNSARLHSPTIDLVNVAFGSVCIAAWGFLLQRETVSESRPPRDPRPGDEQRLQQLRALDDFVSRAGRA